MTTPIHHGQFSLERTYSATPQRVYDAWGDLGAKAIWFIGPPDRWRVTRRELDFRIGGIEICEGRIGDTNTTSYRARFHALTPAARIVFDYDMYLNDLHHSLSLATVELAAVAGGTRLRFTEQVAFLDGTSSAASREEGTAVHLESLAKYLARELSKSP